jgi:uncharacterized membrane protein
VGESYRTWVEEAEDSQAWADRARRHAKRRKRLAWLTALLLVVAGLVGLAVVLL